MNAIQTMFARSNAKRRIVLLALALSCFDLPLQAADSNPPKAMTYQGYLTDGSGVPLGNAAPANYDIIFKIYDASSGGNLKWAEKQTVTIDKGQFSVVLGEGANNGSDPRDPLDTVFAGPNASDRFIDITVKIGSSDVNIAPRLRLVTSPFAFAAKNASALVGADGGTLISSTAPNVLTLNGTLNTTAGVSGLTAAQVPSLDASKITTGTLTRPLSVPGNNVIEMGAGVAGKDVNAGKIGYGTFTPGALDIVGAGNNSTRQVRIWAEGGASMTGSLAVQGNISTTTGNITSPKFRVSQPLAPTFGNWDQKAGTLTTGGGTLLISWTVSGYTLNSGGVFNPGLYINDILYAGTYLVCNSANQIYVAPTRTAIVSLGPGSYTIKLAGNGTLSNGYSYSEVNVIEFPF
jgi:hypothetical protein